MDVTDIILIQLACFVILICLGSCFLLLSYESYGFNWPQDDHGLLQKELCQGISRAAEGQSIHGIHLA